MDKSLIDYLKQIPDCRRSQGCRHPLWLVLLIIIMGMMSGLHLRCTTLSKKTLDEIIGSGNNYVVKVKANQPKLYAEIEQQTQKQEPLKRYEHEEKTRNRQSKRIVEVFVAPETVDPKWQSLGCVIKVERMGTRGNIPYHRIGYYLSSLEPKSRRLAQGIRGHWKIENRLHWVKDAIFQEDISPQKAGSAPINLSLLKTWVLTLLRIHGYDSLTEAISSLSHNLKYMLSFCT